MSGMANPVNFQGVFETLPEPRKMTLSRVHRQDADSPILDLAHALADETLTFEGFERLIEDEFKVNKVARVILFHESINEVMHLYIRLRDLGNGCDELGGPAFA